MATRCPGGAGAVPMSAYRETGRTVLVPDSGKREHTAYQWSSLVYRTMVASIGGIQGAPPPAIWLRNRTQTRGSYAVGLFAIRSDQPRGYVRRLERQNIGNKTLATESAAKAA